MARQVRCEVRFHTDRTDAGTTAALGYRRAEHGPLFLEHYLAEPVEHAVSRAMGMTVERADIVELGNFAAVSGPAMVELWGRAANDLGTASLVAVATLTRSLRSMFTRIGMPIVELVEAKIEAIGGEGADWGRYYEQDPRVCAGSIPLGQAALARHFARRAARVAA